jgi:hypothetical protein
LILTLDNEYAAVLDACVLVPMPLCDTLLRCAEDPGLFRALWSGQILEEVKRTLLGKFEYTPEQVDYRLRMMHEAFPEAAVSVPPDLVGAVPQIPMKRTSMLLPLPSTKEHRSSSPPTSSIFRKRCWLPIASSSNHQMTFDPSISSQP